MKKIILAIEGMTCSGCSSGLERYLNKQNGVIKASVNLVMANALVEYDEKLLNKKKIEEFIKQAGFKSLGEFKEIKIEDKNKKEKIKLILFSILAIIILYISMGHMLNMPTINLLDKNINPIGYTVTLLVLAMLFIVYGIDILKSGLKNLLHKTPNMDTLVSIGIISSTIYSIYSTYMIIQGSAQYISSLYFESVAIVIYFVKLGRYIDKHSKNKTKQAIQKLVKITPNKAVIKINGEEKTVSIDQIHKGDILICKPGEKIAVDGKIVLGKAHFDESFITGESNPAEKEIGQKVIAGSINYDGYIEYEAEKIGKETTISEIVKLVMEASNTKPKITKTVDKVCQYFVPSVITIAVITFIIYLLLGYDFNTALTIFVTILVVACPCSLGLATPLAIVISQGLCATNGILVKNNEVLENVQKVDTIVFDKTGTLTYGKPKISKIINYSNIEEKILLQIVGSIESKSTHPISIAFTDYLKENKIDIISVEDFENISGYGITANLQNEKIILGNSKILSKYNIANKHSEDEKLLTEEGNSILYVVKRNEIVAIIGIKDIIKQEAIEVIEALEKNNIKTIMLTGDNEKTAQKIAQEIGITQVIANVLPSDKTKYIEKLKKENKYIMMCGDGINDSPALASSNVGVSVNNATEIAMDSSDVILTKNNLKSIINLINISKNTIKNIKQNLFWAFFYNALMIPIAMGLFKFIGISINPMIASIAMVFSSVTVILNALRLKI